MLNIQERSTRAQQHEKRRLSLNLSFLDVGPCSVVPLILSTTVSLPGETNTCPRKPSAASSHPKGKLYIESEMRVRRNTDAVIALPYSTTYRGRTNYSDQATHRHCPSFVQAVPEYAYPRYRDREYRLAPIPQVHSVEGAASADEHDGPDRGPEAARLRLDGLIEL